MYSVDTRPHDEAPLLYMYVYTGRTRDGWMDLQRVQFASRLPSGTSLFLLLLVTATEKHKHPSLSKVPSSVWMYVWQFEVNVFLPLPYLG